MSTKEKYSKFVEVVEDLAKELYSDEEWKAVQNTDKNHVGMKYFDMLSTVYQAAFERRPEVFKNIHWVNSEEGFPLWVRPGLDWTPSY